MYRTNDPRFRRRLNDITHTLETANESAQSNIYIFGQHYIKPCFESIGACFTTCFDASCPSLNIAQRDRLRRRGRARSRGRAELSFDFYDDWDEEDNDGLLGWGTDEFDRLVGAGAANAPQPGYGTVNAQPAPQRGMSYPKTRRKGAAETENPTAMPGSSNFWRRLFGARDLRYKPSAADLQEHPGARKRGIRQDLTEGEALLEGDELSEGRRMGRARSGTQGSGHTTDSFSSRGDIFPSDGEDDAIPLDDEFAMVLERRTTADGFTTESSSGRTDRLKRGKRPSAGSRMSTRTVSSRSTRSQTGSGRQRRSRTSSYAHTPNSEEVTSTVEDIAPIAEYVPSLAELKRQEAQVAQEEEEDVVRRRESAQRLASERGLQEETLSSKEATPRSNSPAVAEGGQLPDLQQQDHDENEATSVPPQTRH